MQTQAPIIMRFVIIGMIAASLILVSCDETQQDLQTNIETASEYVLGELVYFNVFNYVDKALRDSTLLTQGVAQIDSAQATYVALSSLTLDFGNGVVCPDGKTRSGQINAVLFGDYALDTAALDVTFASYTVNGRTISGTFNIEKDFSGMDKMLNLVVSNGSLTDTAGNVSTWASVHDLKWLAGDNTYNDLSDDIYAILSGSTADGTAYNGQDFEAEITSDLVYDRSCAWIGEGVLDLSLPGATVADGTIDFGNGDCDDKVTFLFGGSSIPYYMD